MEPAVLEPWSGVPAYRECFDGRSASLGACLRSASAVRLSQAGSLPPTEGSDRHHPPHRRGYASRSGHSPRANSLGDSPAEHQLIRCRSRAQMGGADAPARDPQALIFTRPAGGARSVQINRIRHGRSRAPGDVLIGTPPRWPSPARARSGTPAEVGTALDADRP